MAMRDDSAMALSFRLGRSDEPPGSELLGELIDHLNAAYPGRAARPGSVTSPDEMVAPDGRFLVGYEEVAEGREGRLAALERTDDGFELAEVDLDLRGEGTILGEAQKGRNGLKLASLRRDRDTVRVAREVAIELVDADPLLAGNALLRDEVELLLDEDEREFLLKG